MEIVSGAIPKPTIISREEWGAEDSRGAYSYHPYFDKLTLHHAACCSADDLEEGKNQVYWIQDFHQNGRGWNDIGYHFLVDRAGNIYQGRPETVIGAHVGGANTGNIGVCLLGCYHPPETLYSCTQEITPESRGAIVRLFSWISDTYGQNPSLLLGHRDYFGLHHAQEIMYGLNFQDIELRYLISSKITLKYHQYQFLKIHIQTLFLMQLHLVLN